MAKIRIGGLIILILIFCFSISYAQDNYEDVIYLKNGKILKGKIANIENQQIEFVSSAGTPITIRMDEVSQIRKQKIEANIRSPQDTIFKSKGFVTVAELSYTSGTGEVSTRVGNYKNNLKAYCMSISRGYLVAPTFYIGFGTGYDYYETAKLLPLFVDLRADFVRQRVRPLLALRLGHSLGWKENQTGANWGGFMVQANLGIRLMLSYSRSVHLSIGVKSQQMKIEYFFIRSSGALVPATERLGHQFFTISGGFSF